MTLKKLKGQLGMKINDEVEKQILALHNQGFSTRYIAALLGVGKSTVSKHIKDHNDLAYANRKRYESNIEKIEKTSRIDKEARLKVKEMYIAGATYDEISEKVFIEYTTICRIVNSLIENGEMARRQKPTKRIRQINEIKRETKKPIINVNISGDGVVCNQRISLKCVYGMRPGSGGGLCNYAELTGKCRTVNNAKTGFNPPNCCSCFESRKRGKK